MKYLFEFSCVSLFGQLSGDTVIEPATFKLEKQQLKDRPLILQNKFHPIVLQCDGMVPIFLDPAFWPHRF